MDPLMYSIPEAAKRLGVSRATFYRMMENGEIETFLWHTRRMVRADVLVAFVDKISGREAAA